jgi:hypothetical protein
MTEKILDLEKAEEACDALVAAGFLHDWARDTAVIHLIGCDEREKTSGIYSDEQARTILELARANAR